MVKKPLDRLSYPRFIHGVSSIIMGTSNNNGDRTSLVFVHGFGGHLYHTWSKNGVFWPKDLLSGDVQHVRIITFGYDADVVRLFGRVSRNQIHDHAQTLISDLRGCRKKGQEV